MENDFETHRPLEGKIKKVTLYSKRREARFLSRFWN